jgi:hypothetical protein
MNKLTSFSKYVLLSIACILNELPNQLLAQLPDYLPSNGLVAWYPFNGNANDESGNGNNGLLGNVVSTIDRLGHPNGAYDMNSSFINLSSNIRIQNGQNHTIGAWVKINNLEETRLFSHRNPSGYEGGEIPILNNNIVPYYGETGINFQWLNLTPVGIPFQQYALVICVIDKEAGVLSLYVNGSFTGSFVISNINNVDNNSIAFIGNRLNLNSACTFTIDEFFFYNRAISATEIYSIYQFSNSSLAVNMSPPGIPYQAALRNSNGDILANISVNVRFTIHETATDGYVSFQETHSVNTNELGLFTATIGRGNATQGTFAGINWQQTVKYLEVEVDSGNGYITIGNQQLMSVPYALYAANGPQGPVGPKGEEGQAGPPGPPGEPAPINNGSFNHYVGEHFGGGIVFHVYRDTLGQERGLILAEHTIPSQFCDCATITSNEWEARIIPLNATNPIHGDVNTTRLVLDPILASGLVGIVDDLTLNGYSDWYLPSIYELKLILRESWTMMQAGLTGDDITLNYGLERNWIVSSSIQPNSSLLRIWGPNYGDAFNEISIEISNIVANPIGLAVRKF